jgi:hypothetical protein
LAERFEIGSARVAGFVDPMTKAHDPLFTSQGVSNPGFGFVRRADLPEDF